MVDRGSRRFGDGRRRACAGTPVTAPPPAPKRPRAAVPWYQRFTTSNGVTESITGDPENDRILAPAWTLNQRWGVTVDVREAHGSSARPRAAAIRPRVGAYYQFTPSMRVGGEVSLETDASAWRRRACRATKIRAPACGSSPRSASKRRKLQQPRSPRNRRPASMRAVSVFTPPSAMTGMALPRASWLARKRPSGARGDELAARRARAKHAGIDRAVPAFANAAALCAAPVDPGGSRRAAWRNDRSGQCTPSAPQRRASSASAPISNIKPRERQIAAKLRAMRARVSRAEMPINNGRSARQALGDGDWIGRALGIGEEITAPESPARPRSRLSRAAAAR